MTLHLWLYLNVEKLEKFEKDMGDENSSNADYSDDGEEGQEEYRAGGYHPVHIGDTFHSRYVVVDKLGWGHFSTVWMCLDTKKKSANGMPSSSSSSSSFVAMKVQKSAPHYRDAAYDEIELLKTVSTTAISNAFLLERRAESSAITHPLDPRVVTLVDHFEHSGPHGRHVCMVFELLGDNLLQVIKQYNYRGIPLDIVKRFGFEILLGLDFLHRHCGMIHTDLKVVSRKSLGLLFLILV